MSSVIRRFLFFAALCVLYSLPAWSQISFVNSCSAASTACASVPAHQVGDLFIAIAGRDGTTSGSTPPTLPGGWTQVTTTSINGTSAADSSTLVACKVATTNAEAVTGFTAASAVMAVIYRGSLAGSTATCASTVLGTPSNFATGINTTSTTLTYNAITKTNTVGWVVGLAYAPASTAGIGTAPTGMTNRAAQGSVIGAHDTNGTTANFASGNVTLTTASRLMSTTVEIKAPTVANVTFSPGAGTYTASQTVTLSTTTVGATICYTTDGSTTPAATTPGTCSAGVSSPNPVTIAHSILVKAMATEAGEVNSGQTSAQYNIGWLRVQTHCNTACGATNTCAISGLSATTAGNLLVAEMLDTSGANTTTAITSVTDSASGTGWTLCPSCRLGQTAGGFTQDIDAAYNLSATAGATTITINKSGTSTSQWAACMHEFSTNIGTPAYDTSGTGPAVTTTTTNPAGTALTLGGTQDLIIQYLVDPGTISAITSPYDGTVFAPAGWALATSQMASSGAAPTWTATADPSISGAIAFKLVIATGGGSKRSKLEAFDSAYLLPPIFELRSGLRLGLR